VPPFKTFRFTGFSGGLYASANTFDQPQGTVARISNLLFSERGGFLTVDGSHVITRPGAAPAPLAFASSGQIGSAQPPAPTVPSGATHGFNATGTDTLGGGAYISLPLTVTLSIPAGIQAGDVLVALISVKGIAPGVGATMNPISGVGGWKFLTVQYGTSNDVVNVLYHVVTGKEGSAVTFSYPGPAFNFNGFQMNGAIIAVRGANTIAPLDVFSFNSPSNLHGSCTTAPVTTIHSNDLLLILMQPVNPDYNDGGAGLVSPGNIVGATVLVDAQATLTPHLVALSDTLAIWEMAYAGPGTAGPFTSPTGWPAEASDTLVLAISAGLPPVGQLMGFPINAKGVIVPAPIIQGPDTELTAPQGLYMDASGKLWVADALAGNVGAIMTWNTPAKDSGDFPPDNVIQGPTQTELANPYDVAVDTAGNIYVANYDSAGTGQILIYPAGSSGDVAPTKEIGGANTGLLHPRSVCLDAIGNVYVLDDKVNSIKVWHAGNTGNVAPDQTISGGSTQINNPLAIRVDPNGLLWITCGATTSPNVAAYLLAFNTSGNGNVAPTTRIDSTQLQPQLGLAGPSGLAFDTDANIYVAVLGNKNVLVFPAGSSGTVVPTQTISGFPNGPWGLGIEQ